MAHKGVKFRVNHASFTKMNTEPAPSYQEAQQDRSVNNSIRQTDTLRSLARDRLITDDDNESDLVKMKQDLKVVYRTERPEVLQPSNRNSLFFESNRARNGNESELKCRPVWHF